VFSCIIYHPFINSQSSRQTQLLVLSIRNITSLPKDPQNQQSPRIHYS